MTDKLHITLAQINPVVGDIDGNLALIRKTVQDCPEPTDLVIFPEMASCGYPPEDLVLKPFFMETVAQFTDALVKDSAAFAPALLLPTPWYGDDGRLYNAVHLIENGAISHSIFKHHLPNYGVFDEERLFAPGPLPAPIDFKGRKLGVMVCEDMWFADVAAHLKTQGAELLISVNASPYEVEKNDVRRDHARNRAQENGLPLICVNQCGGQDELVFDGASFIVNESGQTVLQAEEFVEDIHHTHWEWRETGHWLCTTAATHPLHAGEDAIYQALVIGLRDYVTKNGFPGVLIGLSGGIDSALSAALAVDALGKESVHCVMMPSQYTGAESLEDAARCAEMLGVSYDTIPIDGAVSAFETALDSHFHAGTPAITHENIQPRCRGLILMALSNANGQMVLSTGNKSEMAVGYATLYGDMCGGFNALKDVYKTQVYALSQWRNAHKPDHALGPAGPVMPERILTKAPTAELKAGQTDQDTLPPYDKLDDILTCLIEHDMGVADITARGHDQEIVQQVWRMLDRAEYKRRQAPPGIKITSRAFGRDRRYPITNHFTKMIEE